jgi:serine phosphatase RsbU (regulator of sigma subunit)/pSer/pThr/pTyr-binding forkhead associated (FHA) protein
VLNLVITDSTGRRSVAIESGPYAIGRGSDNQLQLSDTRVSRKHAELVQEGSVWKIRDCGSRFGTFVNDNKIEECPLKPGDRIRLGQTELRLEAGDPGTSSSSSAQFDFRQVNALLAGLRALGSTQVLEEVLAIVLDSALEVTGAERGFILLAERGNTLSLKVARARGGVTLTTAKTSQRIPDEVFATGTDRIVTDLLDDSLAQLHAGTVALGIRHVLCTPLKVAQYATGGGGEKRIGVLYLDSRERGYLQTVGALHALAAEAAVVIENARLYQEVVERERVAQELRIAAQMQQQLLPPAYCLADCAELAAVTTPCRDVGGDLFDYDTNRGGLSFAVADVAGKGTSAALLTAVVQGLFAAEAETADSPATVVTRVNRGLCRRAVASRFVTAFYGQLASDGVLKYCNAGHNPPFLVRGSGVARLEAGGTVLGLFDSGVYEMGEERVSTGDVLLLFSDGVTEAENSEGEEFGDDRLAACLDGVRSRSATEALEIVQRGLASFCGTAAARDDVTLMVVKIR